MAKKLLLIDGNNLFHRAYHAMPPLTDKTGENANAVYGFSNMLAKAVAELQPDYIACAFDTAAPTFRHVEFEKYKAQRPPAPPDLYPQLPKVKGVLSAYGIPYFEKSGFEADDILATIAFKAKADEVVILSGDRDVLQLVDGFIKVQMPGWNLGSTTLFGADEVKEKYGITPEQMVDYKSLVGDPSDNVPGVSGIGPKNASSLLQKYGTIESIYEHLDEIGGTTKDKLEAGRDLAITAKRLVKLDLNVDLDFKIDDLKYDPDWEKVRAEFEKLGFKSILAKLPGGEVAKASRATKAVKENNENQLELI